MKYTARFINGAAFKPSEWGEEGKPIVRIAQLTGGEFDNFYDGNINPRYEIADGCLLFSWSATLDSFEWDRGPALLNQHIFKVLPHPNTSKRFLFYSLKHHAPVWADLDAHGSTMRHIKKESLGNKIWLPDIGSQEAIAAFLDVETNRIDKLIEKKTLLIDALQEKLENESLRLLTCGLDDSVHMVEEPALEWVSERPSHWRNFRLKFFFRESTRYSKDGREELLSLRMVEGLIPHNDVSDKTIEPNNLIGYKKVSPGQIVMNRMRAAIGLFGLAETHGIVSPDYSVFDVSADAHPRYFLRLFKTAPMMTAFRILSKGLGTGQSGFMRLNASRFGEIAVAVPSYEEQEAVSAIVESRVAQISHLQAKTRLSIERLNELRSALITAAVTGDIDVATWDTQGETDRRLDQIEHETSKTGARA